MKIFSLGYSRHQYVWIWMVLLDRLLCNHHPVEMCLSISVSWAVFSFKCLKCFTKKLQINKFCTNNLQLHLQGKTSNSWICKYWTWSRRRSSVLKLPALIFNTDLNCWALSLVLDFFVVDALVRVSLVD